MDDYKRIIGMTGGMGAGKSTLCASLAFLEGWRLLSDELTVLDPVDGLLVPVIRDVGNRSAEELRVEINRLKVGARDRTLAASPGQK